MSQYILDGIFWCAGDNIYIEKEKDRNADEVRFEEICLNDYIKKNIKENSKVVITIDVL